MPLHKDRHPDRQGQIITVNHSANHFSTGTEWDSRGVRETGPFITSLSTWLYPHIKPDVLSVMSRQGPVTANLPQDTNTPGVTHWNPCVTRARGSDLPASMYVRPRHDLRGCSVCKQHQSVHSKLCYHSHMLTLISTEEKNSSHFRAYVS